MEAKDTVMDITKFRTSVHKLGSPNRQLEELCENIAKAQAEISFKMGYNQALKDIKDGFSPSLMV